MQKLKTIQEIKSAVDAEKKVFADNSNYVVKNAGSMYIIHSLCNDYVIGLHGLKGSQYENDLNGNNFYTE